MTDMRKAIAAGVAGGAAVVAVMSAVGAMQWRRVAREFEEIGQAIRVEIEGRRASNEVGVDPFDNA